MARLSVIIPVYNSISTLERCVNSVLAQELDDIEIILVDDGSDDGSSVLCDDLALKNPQIRVIHRKNGGLSAARNTGIASAQAKWLAFVDSDDALAPDTLKSNLDYAEENPVTDLVEFPVTVRYGSPDSFNFDFEPYETSGTQVFTHWIQSRGYNHCFACNKLFRATLFEKIHFPEGQSFEDAAICPAIIRSCRTIRYSNSGRYLYYESQGSITHRYRFNNQEPLFRHNITLLDEITREGFDIRPRLELWSVCLNLLTDLRRCKDADYKYITAQAAALESLKPHPAHIFRSELSFRQKIKVFAAYCIGTGTVCKTLGIRKYS